MVSHRPLPHRTEAENAVVGGVLLRGGEALAEVLEILSEADFYQPRAQAVLRAMRVVDERGEPLDVVTLEAQLQRSGELELVGGIEGLARFDRYATAHNVKAHAELVRESAMVRNMVLAAREVVEEGMDPDLELGGAEFVAQAQQRVSDASAGARRRGPRHVREAMLGVFEGIQTRVRAGGGLTGCPTGFAQLDEMTAGLQPTDLVILAARPSMGKTALALGLAANAAVTAQRHVDQLLAPPRWPVLFFSLEMGEAQLIERVLCAEAQVDAADVRRGRRLLQSDFRALIAAATRMTDHSDLYIDDRPALEIGEVRRAATRWWDKNCPPLDPDRPDGPRRGLIMVDYLQLLRAKGAHNSREQEIAAISSGLKALAKELKVPVLALSQLNRAVDSRADHRPQLSDLRESGAIEQDADVIMFIYREERYLSEDAPEEKRREAENKAEIIIGKQRNGPIGTVPLVFLKKQARFTNAIEMR